MKMRAWSTNHDGNHSTRSQRTLPLWRYYSHYVSFTSIFHWLELQSVCMYTILVGELMFVVQCHTLVTLVVVQDSPEIIHHSSSSFVIDIEPTTYTWILIPNFSLKKITMALAICILVDQYFFYSMLTIH